MGGFLYGILVISSASMKPKSFFRVNNSSLKQNAGYTLIELLLVISIIGFVSTIVLTSTASARIRARDTVRLQNRKQVIDAINLFVADHSGYWPDSGGGYVCLAPSAETCWAGTYSGSDTLIAGLQPFLREMPKTNAPVGTIAHNRMLYRNTGTDVNIWWFLESTKRQSCPGGDGFYDFGGGFYGCREKINN